MSGPNFRKYIEEDARLVMLRELRDMNGVASDAILTHALDAYGHARGRDWVRTQLNVMQDLGVLTTEEAGSVIISRITRLGVEHLERRAKVEGIKQPSLGA